jgi:hypothetical protein
MALLNYYENILEYNGQTIRCFLTEDAILPFRRTTRVILNNFDNTTGDIKIIQGREELASFRIEKGNLKDLYLLDIQESYRHPLNRISSNRIEIRR